MATTYPGTWVERSAWAYRGIFRNETALRAAYPPKSRFRQRTADPPSGLTPLPSDNTAQAEQSGRRSRSICSELFRPQPTPLSRCRSTASAGSGGSGRVGNRGGRSNKGRQLQGAEHPHAEVAGATARLDLRAAALAGLRGGGLVGQVGPPGRVVGGGGILRPAGGSPLHPPVRLAGRRIANSANRGRGKIAAKPAFAADFPALWDQACEQENRERAGYNFHTRCRFSAVTGSALRRRSSRAASSTSSRGSIPRSRL